MNAEVIELTDAGMPGLARIVKLVFVPRIGELVAFDDDYFEVVNVVYRLHSPDHQTAGVFVRPTKKPYQEPTSRFGFGRR